MATAPAHQLATGPRVVPRAGAVALLAIGLGLLAQWLFYGAAIGLNLPLALVAVALSIAFGLAFNVIGPVHDVAEQTSRGPTIRSS